jgi:hypothetical protein
MRQGGRGDGDVRKQAGVAAHVEFARTEWQEAVMCGWSLLCCKGANHGRPRVAYPGGGVETVSRGGQSLIMSMAKVRRGRHGKAQRIHGTPIDKYEPAGMLDISFVWPLSESKGFNTMPYTNPTRASTPKCVTSFQPTNLSYLVLGSSSAVTDISWLGPSSVLKWPCPPIFSSISSNMRIYMILRDLQRPCFCPNGKETVSSAKAAQGSTRCHGTSQ